MTNRIVYLVRHGEYSAPPGAAPEDGALTAAGIRQAELLADRLSAVPFAAIHHSPWARAAQTADILAEPHPDVPMFCCEELQECVPVVPPPGQLTPQQAHWFLGLETDVVRAGPRQAGAALDRFTGPTADPDGETRHELVVSHGNLINWLVCQALDAPPWSWLRMLDYHCALTVLLFMPDRTKLVSYNDMGHLPPELRGTEYPVDVRV
jgi:probable phosphoglycerate mutase